MMATNLITREQQIQINKEMAESELRTRLMIIETGGKWEDYDTGYAKFCEEHPLP